MRSAFSFFRYLLDSKVTRPLSIQVFRVKTNPWYSALKENSEAKEEKKKK